MPGTKPGDAVSLTGGVLPNSLVPHYRISYSWQQVRVFVEQFCSAKSQAIHVGGEGVLCERGSELVRIADAEPPSCGEPGIAKGTTWRKTSESDARGILLIA